MAEQRIGPGGEHGRETPPMVGDVCVADGEDPLMKAMQRAGLHPARNRSTRVAEGPDELSNRYDSVLAGRQRSEVPTLLPA
ncbi:MAG TPA: hypothetical protein VGF09_00105 [Solirubrobacterales bacterium]|jgi:hypothetical protein